MVEETCRHRSALRVTKWKLRKINVSESMLSCSLPISLHAMSCRPVRQTAKMQGPLLRDSIRQRLDFNVMHCPRYHDQIGFELARHIKFKKFSCEDPKSCIASPFGTSSTKQPSDGMTHQRRTSLLTKEGQSTSSIGSTLTWSLISSGACIRASLKILRLPLFSHRSHLPAPTP